MRDIRGLDCAERKLRKHVGRNSGVLNTIVLQGRSVAQQTAVCRAFSVEFKLLRRFAVQARHEKIFIGMQNIILKFLKPREISVVKHGSEQRNRPQNFSLVGFGILDFNIGQPETRIIVADSIRRQSRRDAKNFLVINQRRKNIALNRLVGIVCKRQENFRLRSGIIFHALNRVEQFSVALRTGLGNFAVEKFSCGRIIGLGKIKIQNHDSGVAAMSDGQKFGNFIARRQVGFVQRLK